MGDVHRTGRRSLDHMRWLLILAAAWCLALSQDARADKWDRYMDWAWSSGGSSATATPTKGGAHTFQDLLKMPGPGAKTTVTGPKRKFPFIPSPDGKFIISFSAQAMGKALASPAAAVPLLAFPIIDYLLDEACVKMAGGTYTLAPGGQWQECRYGSQEQRQYYASFGSTVDTGWQASGEQACTVAQEQFNANYQAGYCPNNNYTCSFSHTYTAGAPGTAGSCVVRNHVMPPNTTQTFTMAMSTRLGTTTVVVGYDPIPASSAETILSNKMDQWTQCDFTYGYGSCAQFDGKASKDVLDALMNSGQAVEYVIEVPWVQTPIVEAPKQTTQTDAQGNTTTSTEVTTNDYSCLVIDNGKAVRCDQYRRRETTTAQTTNPNGTGTVTTTTTTVVTQEGNDESECEPGTIACSQMGTPPEPDPLKTQEVAVSMTPDSGWNFGTAACPAPRTITVQGKTLSFSMQMLCDFAVGIKPVIVGLAYLTAILAFFGFARKGS